MQVSPKVHRNATLRFPLTLPFKRGRSAKVSNCVARVPFRVGGVLSLSLYWLRSRAGASSDTFPPSGEFDAPDADGDTIRRCGFGRDRGSRLAISVIEMNNEVFG